MILKDYNCYAIFFIPNGYEDFLGYGPVIYKTEFFNCMDAGYDISNVEGMIEVFKNYYKIPNFEIHFTFLDFDHFKELYKDYKYAEI